MSAIYSSLENTTVFVSGGASGIGAALVDAFVAQRARVAFCDLDEAAGRALCERYEGPSRPWFASCDIRDIEAYRHTLDAAGEALGPISVLVNNAGRDDRCALDELTPERWHDLIDTNLTHHVFAVQRLAPAMARAGGGSIINMGSISWLRGRPNLIAYTAAKAAISGISRTLARELGGANIRVNAVLPGSVLTERQKALWFDPADAQRFIELQCLKFPVEMKHIADMVLFLASDQSAAVTGQNMIVDAGLAQVSVVG
ncbi:SDR family NAD(P)-dependent oxidoreductase [Paraburkholderia unamae]|uniref:NAD(P)-dependent dehydrogenase (Short-subunit alcohol dehydrogenase family) n=1 Tax=Paraburkholderia unamae TaxID=219649 RepID=A0ABX5KU28_9BURK|nr:SDR family oxidoreductase [Paraburkholderia unamae]PVX83974.1 NAD(P)-dependent dehydrogenase (short-subunit alcohol dehydrogenase family) [Paraburkholderia unamae]CAG9265009.1 Sulfoquinovose 1-dehydrogenase [Paraburkholderia unamae]